MTEFDDNIGVLLKKLDDLGIADNTIVIITTDNGAETFSWPDGGTTPFRGEKNTNWEGGYRVPMIVRWPGVIKPGTVINDIAAHEDWMPTLLAAAGEPNVTEKLLTGYESNGRTFKVHLDGYNLTDLLAGKSRSPRIEFFYWTDDGDFAGLRYDKWKLVFLEQREHGFNVWANPLISLRVPLIEDLRADPYERASYEASDYDHWMIDRVYLLVPAQAIVGKFLMTFKEFPPRQSPASFGVDQVMQKLREGMQDNN
jgi:arylsulfatase A-like enzyme